MCDVRTFRADSKIVSLICRLWPPKKFSQSFILFYEGQIPNVAILLTSGIVEIESPTGVKIFKQYTLFGLDELLDKKPSLMSVKILENSEACIFDSVSFSQKNQFYEELVEVNNRT